MTDKKHVLVLQHFYEELIDAYGTEQYEKVEQEVAQLFPTYARHARILLENFLKISLLI